MKLANGRRALVAVMLVCTLWITGCQPQTPSQFSQVQAETSKRGATAVAKDATKGGEFNKFFPAAQAGYERVYTQEKKGFAEAKLKRDGKDVAMLAISDTRSIPGSAAKYENAKETIEGYPAVSIGTTQTSILVGDYQVKVLSRSPDFTPDDRAAWLTKFDLSGLKRLN